MTEQQIDRDQLRAVAHHAEQANSAVYLAPRDLLALLDQAEARLAEEKHLRMKATAAATKVEARIKAVRDVHWADKALNGHTCAEDGHDWPCPTVRALDG